MDMHETTGPMGIVIPDPDQGTPYLHLQFAMPSTAVMAWEPFADGTEGGHNLIGFCRRWAEWAASDEPWFQTIDPRFGHPLMIPRAALGPSGLVSVAVAYHRKEDVRAGHRALAVPGQPAVVPVGPGMYEVRIPHGRRRR